MILEVWKKMLIGKKVACSTSDCREIYTGIVTDVTINTTSHYGDVTLFLKEGNVGNLCVIFFTPNSGPCYMYEHACKDGKRSYRMGEEWVVDSAITFDRFVKKIIEPAEETFGKTPPPPQPPSVYELIKKYGTFTGCKELVEKFTSEGLIRKENGVLHVSMELSSEPGCICGIAETVEQIESLTRDLLKFFEAEEVIYYGLYRSRSTSAIVEVEPGQQGEIYLLPNSCSHCGTYPVIKGLPMKWEFKTE